MWRLSVSASVGVWADDGDWLGWNSLGRLDGSIVPSRDSLVMFRALLDWLNHWPCSRP